MTRRQWVRDVFGGFFALSSVFHAVALWLPSISIPEPVAEHLVFAFVNILFAFAVLLQRFPRLVLLTMLGMLTGQQVMRHLPLFVDALQAHRFDYQSLTTVAGLLVVSTVILLEKPER